MQRGSSFDPFRLALVLPLAWWTVRLAGGSTWCFVDYTNLAFHEAGHLLLAFAPAAVHYLGGTLGQLAVPLLLGGYFLLARRQPSGSAVCLWWLGESTVNISVYMADARALALPLVGGGDHDWNELFYRAGLLTEPAVQTIAAWTHRVGVALMLAGLLWVTLLGLPAKGRLLAERWPRLAPLLEPGPSEQT